MIYKFLKNCEVLNSFFGERLIYKVDRQGVIPLNELPAVMGLPGKSQPVESKTEKKPVAPKSTKEAPKVTTSQTNAPEKTRKGPKTVREALRKTRKRLEEDLFDRQSLQPYIDKLGDAIEKLGADNLRKFIIEHNSYSGDFRKWNRELCETFELKPTDGALEAREHMKYAAALQMFLAGHFDAQNKKDVFQTLKERKANPFIYIDGKLGGYTMSALAAYWNYKYPDKSKGNNKLGYADLEQEYGDLRKNREIFGNAIDYLKKQLGDKSPSSQPSLPGQAPTTAPAATPGQNLPPAAIAAPGVAPIPNPKPKQNGEKLSPQLQKQAEDLVNGAVAFNGLYGKLKYWYDEQVKNYKYLEDEKNKDPSTYFLKFQKRKGSWPDKVFTEYKDLYDKLNVLESEKVSDSRIIVKFQQLKDTVNDYYRQVESIKKYLYAVYLKKAQKIMSDYDLPSDIQVTNLDEKELNVDRESGFSNLVESEVYWSHRKDIQHAEHKKPDGIDNLYKEYFKAGLGIKKVPQVLTADMFVGKSAQDKENKMRAFVVYIGGGKEDAALAQLKLIIHFRNMFRVNNEYEILKNHYAHDFDKAIGILDNNHQKYLEFKSKKKENEFASYVVNQIWRS